jgi:hypothetical protein
VTGYRRGQSLADLAAQFGIHRRTVAAHLEARGVPRRINKPKMTSADTTTPPVAATPANPSQRSPDLLASTPPRSDPLPGLCGGARGDGKESADAGGTPLPQATDVGPWVDAPCRGRVHDLRQRSSPRRQCRAGEKCAELLGLLGPHWASLVGSARSRRMHTRRTGSRPCAVSSAWIARSPGPISVSGIAMNPRWE